MERCTLCGGKLVKGKCTECGLDNTKNDRKYKLNTHNEKETRFHHGDCEDHLNRNCDSSMEWGTRSAGSSGKRNTGSSGTRSARSSGSGGTRSAGSSESSGNRMNGGRQSAGGGNGGFEPESMMSKARRDRTLKERSSTGTVKKKSVLNRLVFWIVLLVILFQVFGGVLAGFFSYLGRSGSSISTLTDKLLTLGNGDDDSDWEADDAENPFAEGAVAAEKPEEIIWNEQSAGYFEEGLTMGIYTVGYEIPAGTYQMYCAEGTVWCYLIHGEDDGSEFFALYSTERQESYAESFGECDYYELSDELELEEGDIIYVEECDEGVFIRGEGDGEDSLKQHEPQGLPETVVAQDGMEAGADFEPGVYDVTLGDIPEDDYGSAYLNITNQEGNSYYIALHQEMPTFYRFPFHEGDSIELTSYGADVDVTLTPSY